MGPGQKLLTRSSFQVIFLLLGLGQPPLGLENFLQKSQIFQFFILYIIQSGQKISRSKLGQPLIYRVSKVCFAMGQVRAHLYPKPIENPSSVVYPLESWCVTPTTAQTQSLLPLLASKLGFDPGSDWVRSGQPPLGLENFQLKIPNFSIFYPSGQTKSHRVG